MAPAQSRARPAPAPGASREADCSSRSATWRSTGCSASPSSSDAGFQPSSTPTPNGPSCPRPTGTTGCGSSGSSPRSSRTSQPRRHGSRPGNGGALAPRTGSPSAARPSTTATCGWSSSTRTASVTADHSRGMLLAEGATGRQRDKLERALEESRVAVSLDPEMPESMLTARVLLTTLRRGPGQLLLERSGLPASAADELAAVVDAVDPARPLTVVNNAGGTLAVRLHVGADAGSAVRVVPEGYGAHIAGQRTAVIRPPRPGNPVGAVYAAALGAAEAFKRTARVLPRRRELHRHLRFCPVTLSSDLAAAPDLPAELLLDLALVGVGAIGTGIVLLLDAVGAAGRVLAVDYQRFGPENIGTYSLGGAAEVQAAPWKTDMARAALSRFDVIPFREPADRLPAAMDARVVPWFPLVLTALDTAAARRDAQRLWPDRLIDAATGDTMLGIHDHEHGNGPCMICFFPPDRSGESAAQRLPAATGLPLERTMRRTDPLTETDLVN